MKSTLSAIDPPLTRPSPARSLTSLSLPPAPTVGIVCMSYFLGLRPPDRRQSTVQVDMYTGAGDLTVGLTLTGGALTPGRWGHVAFAIDTTGTSKLFVDGAEVASGSFQGVQISTHILSVFFDRAAARVW